MTHQLSCDKALVLHEKATPLASCPPPRLASGDAGAGDGRRRGQPEAGKGATSTVFVGQFAPVH
jgi:hypothetical protein